MKPTHVVAIGPFGEAVAHDLAKVLDVVITKPTSEGYVQPRYWPDASVHILAAWRPVLEIAHVLDTVAFTWQVPWLPVIYEHPYLFIGPTVVPGVGPCYSCFRLRYLQHSKTEDLTDVLDSYYASHPAAGPRGYLPTTVAFAAAIVWEVTQRLTLEPEVEAGQIRQINLLSLETHKSRVVGVHGCEHCGCGRDERTRSVAQLAADLNFILP